MELVQVETEIETDHAGNYASGKHEETGEADISHAIVNQSKSIFQGVFLIVLLRLFL